MAAANLLRLVGFIWIKPARKVKDSMLAQYSSCWLGCALIAILSSDVFRANLTLATKSIVEVLILLISLLANRLNLNSTNSSKPPSSDPDRKKKPKSRTGKKPRGQKGHIGTTLKKVDDPDIIEPINIDRRTLPAGRLIPYNRIADYFADQMHIPVSEGSIFNFN